MKSLKLQFLKIMIWKCKKFVFYIHMQRDVLGIIPLKPAHQKNHRPSRQYWPKEEIAGLLRSPIPGDRH